ncbi:MAG: hypothetical protein RLZZ22_148 [Pseudomonadota bacterium]|jgi:hypothetical protein
MSAPQPLSAFTKSLRSSYVRSRASSISIERRDDYPDKLKVFTKPQRTGQPLKSADRREDA